MKKILARGGIEFIAVVLGITISLWIEDEKNKTSELKEQISLLENLKTSLKLKSVSKKLTGNFLWKISYKDFQGLYILLIFQPVAPLIK